MRKFLLCSMISASVWMGDGVRAANMEAVQAEESSGNKGMVEVAAVNSDSTGAPTGPLHKTAPLSADPMTFYMFATGEYKAEIKDLIITGNTEVPDFFAVVDEKFVFKKPAPMATIQIPEGFTTYLTITLEGVKNKTGFNDNIKNYVALGVREQTAAEGTYAAILNVSSKASECFHVDSSNTLELVPLISKTDMSSGEYTAADEGAEITTCPALSEYGDTSFDFGAIFGVKTECSDVGPEKRTAWEKQN